VLSDRTGGSQDDLVQSYVLSAAEVGSPNATWSLKVSDTADVDTGAVRSFRLEFK